MEARVRRLDRFAIAMVHLVITLSAPGCAGRRATGPKPSVTVVVHGDRAARRAVSAELREAELPVELRFADPPNVPPTPPEKPELGPRLAAARAHYIAAEFDACAKDVTDDAAVDRTLAAEDRVTAARLLLWRIACRTGAGELELARESATAFATLDLDVPIDIEAVTPEVEAILGEAIAAVRAAPRAALRIHSNAVGAITAIDGRPASCTTPCAIDLPPGDHLIQLRADGWVPSERRVRLAPAGTSVDVVLAAAGPELAASQWTLRYGGEANDDSAGSVSLLARATRARRLVLLTAEGDPAVRIRGVMAIDERIAARAERTATAKAKTKAKAKADTATAVVRDLLVAGKVVAAPRPIYKRPVFWIAIILSAAGAATLTGLLVREPDHRTVVKL